MHIVSAATVLPEHRFDQEALIDAAKTLWLKKHVNPGRVEQLYRAVQVNQRYLALSKDEYLQLDSFTKANDAFIRVGTNLGEQAITQALAKAGLPPTAIDAVFFTTVTGLSVPTIDARLINRLRLRPDVKRTPLFGIGCLGGAAGIARMHDYLKAYPEQVAVLLSVELCSLTLQAEDFSIPNLISTGLFGDGAAAVVGVGDAHPARNDARLRTVASRSEFYYDTERVMGWDIGSSGFKIVLDANVPTMVERHVRKNVDDFLTSQSLCRRDIRSWICHPGGPKVLQAMEQALELPTQELQLTWDSLRDIGNLSSASVLCILQQTIEQRPQNHGTPAVMLAMGPGFCSELVLLRWT